MGAIFLAAKVEEVAKKIRDVCNVFWRLYQRSSNLPLQVLDIYKEVTPSLFYSHLKDYWKLKTELIKSECYILKELGFMLLVVHPHKFILNYIKVLDGSQQLSQIAWNYCNDRFLRKK
jgi:hypothetical protein